MASADTTGLPAGLRLLVGDLPVAAVDDDQKWILCVLRNQGPAVIPLLWRMLGSEQAGLETVPGCGRGDLAAWVQSGGPLPDRLRKHLVGCPRCAQAVRQANTVRTGLALLRTQRVPPHLTRRSGERALRMLRRALRSSRAARRLLAMRPDLPPWRKAQIHLVRLSAGAAAAGLFLMLRIGTLAGFQGAHHALRGLGSVHWNRHIDPDHEWLGPFPLDPPGSV